MSNTENNARARDRLHVLEAAQRAWGLAHLSDPDVNLRDDNPFNCCVPGSKLLAVPGRQYLCAAHYGHLWQGKSFTSLSSLFHPCVKCGTEVGGQTVFCDNCIHGTSNGYSRHKKSGEEPCEPCKEAERLYRNGLNWSKGKYKPRQRVECGTHSGYVVHIRNGESACRACKDKVNEYTTARRRAAGVSPRGELAGCGTYGAHQRHQRRGETCDPCRLAYNEYQKESRRARLENAAFNQEVRRTAVE
jgi:hypothetical protein